MAPHANRARRQGRLGSLPYSDLDMNILGGVWGGAPQQSQGLGRVVLSESWR